jgi:hypothetical protein
MSASPDELWEAVRKRCAALEPGSELVTPLSERPFRVGETGADRLQIRFVDSHETRTLWSGQFELLADRIEQHGIAVSDLAPGVEPYVTVLTLLAAFGVADGDIVATPDSGDEEGSPYLVSPADARTRPERLHDDALLLADVLDGRAPLDPDNTDTDTLTDLYVLLSDVQHDADSLRQTVRDTLLGRLGPDQELHGRFGTVRRTSRARRRPKDDETVFDALDEHGIPHEWVVGVDPDKLDVVLAVTDLQDEEVYDREEQVYVQKTAVEEGEKYARLRGLADRIEELDGAAREELREELRSLEARLDEALSA